MTRRGLPARLGRVFAAPTFMVHAPGRGDAGAAA